MRSFRVALIGILSVCIGLSGCHVSSTPRTVARYKPGRDPELKEAKYWGEYRLYALENKQSNPPPDAEPVATVRLSEDEKFGFSRDVNGYVVATAADQTFPLEKRGYVWQMKADEAQPDKGRRDLVVLGVFVLIVGLGAIAVATADPFGN
jgi:hypothetical protein